MVMYTACIRTRFMFFCIIYFYTFLDISTYCMCLTHWMIRTLELNVRIVWYVQGDLVDFGAEQPIFVQFVLHSTLRMIWADFNPHLFYFILHVCTCVHCSTTGASEHLFHNFAPFFFKCLCSLLYCIFLTYIVSGNRKATTYLYSHSPIGFVHVYGCYFIGFHNVPFAILTIRFLLV